jgi:hypothetical protein
MIRRRAVEADLALVTDLKLARAIVGALRRTVSRKWTVRALDEYTERESETRTGDMNFVSQAR